MPIDTYWNAAAPPGDFGSTGNWTNGVPNAAGDVGVFDGRSQVSVEAGLSRGAVSFAIKTTPQYTGNIGTAATPLEWNGPVGFDFVVHRGSGRCSLKYLSATPSVTIIDSQNLVDAALLHGTLQSIFVKRGGVVIAADGDMVETSHIVLAGPEAYVDFLFKSLPTGPGWFEVRGGKLVVRREAITSTRVMQSGGIIEWLVPFPAQIFPEVPFVHQSGGVFRFTPSPAVADTFFGYIDGILDLSGNIKNSGDALVYLGLNGQVISEISNPDFKPAIDLTLEYP